MAGTLIKKVMLRIAADDGDTEQKLDKISAKADELGRKHPDLKVKINTAAASAKLAALRMELKRTDDEAKTGESRFGALGQALNIGLLGGIGGGIGEMSMFQKVMMGLNLATGLGEPLVAGLTVAVGGLSAGLVSAGAGLGVFGLVAKSVWSGVSTNISSATAALNKMSSARTLKQQTADAKAFSAALKGLDPGQKSLVIGAANAESGWHSFVQSAAGGVASVLVPALNLVPRALQLAKGFLGPVESSLRGIVADVSKGLDSKGFSSFIGMLQKNAGPMITKLAVAIGHVAVGIGGILRAFMPMAQEMGHGLDDITGKFAKWGTTLSGHSGFQSLMSMFRTETPMAVHALTQIGSLIKTVVSNMTGLSTFSNSKMLLQALNPILGILNRLAKVPGLVNMVLYLKLATDGGRKLHTAFTGLQSVFGVFKGGASALQDFNAGLSNSSAAASDATGAWGTFGGKISKIGSSLASAGSSVASFVAGYAAKMGEAIAATGTWIAEHAVAAGTFIAENVTMAASATAAFIAENAATLGLVAGIAALVGGIIYLATHWRQVWSGIKTVFRDAVDFVKAHWKLLPAMFLGPLGIVATIVLTHFTQIKGYAMDLVSGVRGILNWFGRLPGLFMGWFDEAANAVYSASMRMISFVRTIPGKILSGLANLGSMLFSLGARAISSLISGLGSMMGGLISKAESWGHDIANAIGSPFGIHFSEPSEASKMVTAGRRIALGLGTGMDSGNSAVRASAGAPGGVGRDQQRRGRSGRGQPWRCS